MTDQTKTSSNWLVRSIIDIIDRAPVNPNEKLRLQHFAVFVFLGGLVMACYGAYSLATGQILLSAFIFLSGTSLIFGWLLMCHLPLGQFVYRANALLFSGLLLYMLVIGGENGSKSLWMFTFPLIVYFLLGKVEGTIWSGGLLLAAMVLLLVPLPGWSPYPYGKEFMIRFATVYLGISVVAYWFEGFRDQYRQGMEAEKQHLKDIIAALPDALCVKDLEGRYRLCNPAFLAMSGLEENQIIGKRSDELFLHHQAGTNVKHELPMPQAGAPFLRFHEAGILGEGNLAVYDTIKQSLKSQHGSVYGYLEVYRDRAIPQVVEQGMSKSLTQEMVILDGIDMQVYVVDVVTHQILYMNRSMKEIFGHNLEGQICWQICHGAAKPCAHCAIPPLLMSNNFADTIESVNYQPSVKRWYLHRDRLMRWIDQRSVKLGVAVDITRIKQGAVELLDNAEIYPENTTVGSILLIDDDQMVRELGEIMLSSFGFKVYLAGDGVEAFEIFRQHQDDIGLVCCDLLMPRMDGWQTIAALRALAPGIRVIMISGMEQHDHVKGDMYPEQPQAFLKKPYSLEKLRETISRVLGVEVGAA